MNEGKHILILFVQKILKKLKKVGHIKSSHTCHWRVPNWSQLRLGIEYSSPPLFFDDLKW